MTDPRPRPKYGEYAPPTSTEPSSTMPAPVTPQTGLTPQLGVTPQPFANTAGDAADPGRPRRMWDVLLTATLLLFGVVDVINTFGTIGNLGPVLREGLAAQGVEAFSSDAIAAEAGGAANIVRVVVLVLTVVFALIQIQRRRLAFWIPIVGAAIAGIALMVAIFVAVMSDPGFIAYVDGLSQQ
jgi:hypothetical protein